jgi:hypothetical protein
LLVQFSVARKYGIFPMCRETRRRMLYSLWEIRRTMGKQSNCGEPAEFMSAVARTA